jgi:alginate O-acetyltransferase complex protein AlgJ
MKEFHVARVRPEREDAALRDLGSTRAEKRVRRLLIGAFLITIATVPLLQTWREWDRGGVGRTPAIVEFASAFPHALSSAASELPEGLVPAVASANRSLKQNIHGFEQSLEKHSFLTSRFLPRVQWFVSRFLNLGNEKVFFGREGWLYYRPDVDYLVGAGFSIVNSVDGSGSPAGKLGPIPAILKFRDDLALRGIRLIVVPVPVKPMVEPEHLAPYSCRSEEILQNPSYAIFEKELRSQGVEVLDLRSLLIREKKLSGRSQYLKRDTHWTPDAMEHCAGLLAERLQNLLPEDFPNGEGKLFGGECVSIKSQGDLVGMLDLPKSAPIFSLEEAVIRPSKRADSGHWKPNTSSSVLLLGDSFTRIYSALDLHWGRDSGLAERLSEHLGRNVDVLAINAGGSSSVRQSLARSPERLTGKKAVVYEFSMRELSGGDWKVIPLPEPVAPGFSHPIGGTITVTGTVAEVSEIPASGATPYRDFVRSIRLSIEGGGTSRNVLVFVQAMRNKMPTAAESLKVGNKVTLHLVPWSRAEEKYGSLNRSELQGPSADLPDVYWSDDY